MQPDDPRARRLLDVTFALLLLGGVMTALYAVLAVWDWISSWGEDALGIIMLGVTSFVPVTLALVGASVGLLLAPSAGIVRPAVAVIAAHVAWWVALIGIEIHRADPSFGRLAWLATTLEPALFAGAAILLSVRWLTYLRRPRRA
ncbi:MAG TPA: hypothetical protein VFT28_14710 [Gemmatimonadales bacterium]|nr:hypothetical protein [Gemmatimonadales bacterium]